MSLFNDCLSVLGGAVLNDETMGITTATITTTTGTHRISAVCSRYGNNYNYCSPAPLDISSTNTTATTSTTASSHKTRRVCAVQDDDNNIIRDRKQMTLRNSVDGRRRSNKVCIVRFADCAAADRRSHSSDGVGQVSAVRLCNNV